MWSRRSRCLHNADRENGATNTNHLHLCLPRRIRSSKPYSVARRDPRKHRHGQENMVLRAGTILEDHRNTRRDFAILRPETAMICTYGESWWSREG